MGNPPNSNWEGAEAVCEECLRQTKTIKGAVNGKGEPMYATEKSFFLPRLQSVNHLALGKSRIISSKTTLLLEYFALVFQRTNEDIQEAVRRLFPRHPRTWGKYFGGAAVVGRTTYAGREDHDRPIHHLHVELWARTRWLSWRRLACGFTDHEGRFRLPYDLREAAGWDIHSVRLEISQIRHRYVAVDQPESYALVAAVIPIPKQELVGMEYNLRDIQIDLWAYRTDTNLPRTKINDHEHDAPEAYVDAPQRRHGRPVYSH